MKLRPADKPFSTAQMDDLLAMEPDDLAGLLGGAGAALKCKVGAAMAAGVLRTLADRLERAPSHQAGGRGLQ